jgi:hypothetical protein
MPQRENHEPTDITLDQVQSLSGVLIPLIRDALRPEFHSLRNDFVAAAAKQALQVAEEIEKLDQRVGSLERFRWKLAGIWAAVSVAATFLADLLWHLMAKN